MITQDIQLNSNHLLFLVSSVTTHQSTVALTSNKTRSRVKTRERIFETLFKSVSVVGIQITRGRSVSWLKITPDNDVNCFAATFVKTESRP